MLAGGDGITSRGGTGEHSEVRGVGGINWRGKFTWEKGAESGRSNEDDVSLNWQMVRWRVIYVCVVDCGPSERIVGLTITQRSRYKKPSHTYYHMAHLIGQNSFFQGASVCSSYQLGIE